MSSLNSQIKSDHTLMMMASNGRENFPPSVLYLTPIKGDENLISNSVVNINCENSDKRKRRKCKKKKKMDQSANTELPQEIRTYRKRFFILILFSLYSASNAFQWLQYAIITRKISILYGIDDLFVNLTSMIYMIVFVPGMLPASYILDTKGIRVAILIGSLANFAGAFVKCFSLQQEQFVITMIGQVLASVANLFVLSIPPRLAAVWFDEKEVSTATSIGVFGNQLGICAGFFLPPLIVTSSTVDGISSQLSLIFYGTALLTGFLFVLILLFLDDKPPSPPSIFAAKAKITQEEISFFQSLRYLVTERNMILLAISYGINVGVFYAISTILDQMIASAYPGEEAAAGRIGAIITVVGTVGAMCSGWILDRFHLFKETTLVLYLFSTIGLLGFTLTLNVSLPWSHLVAAFLGFFMTGYLPIGFEYAAEITYPQPEGNSAGLLNLSAQIFGILLSLLATIMVSRFGFVMCNGILSAMLFIGLVMTALIRGSLKRREASATVSYS
ncbi:histamine transporter [Brevipalpus obovatus]|uniref:histamine transporter n=1 Tax=Brevipalpus obovatus TaxID=246614 RepID=UPI003D9ED52D